MRIELINEDSQADKNSLIYDVLKEVSERYGNTVDNYGMYSEKDEHQINYIQVGVVASVIIETGMADFVVTGCGTGEGAMLALNSFPGVLCGHVVDPSDAYMFMQINDGNAIALPFAKGFGWGAELNLTYIFEKLFEGEPGGGYPKERVVPEQANKKILDEVKKITHKDMMAILREIDQEFLYQTVNRNQFKKYFFENAEDGEIKEYIRKILQK